MSATNAENKTKGCVPVRDRDTAPFRADHVGSLLRPAELLEAREEFSAGRIPAERLREVEDAAIDDAVRRQDSVGLRSATDGEFRREQWHMDFLYQLGGVSKVEGESISIRFRNEEGEFEATPAGVRVGKLHLAEPIFADHFQYLQQRAEHAVPKLTIPSPSMLHYRGGMAAIDPEAYEDVDEFWSDLAAVYAEQIQAMYDLGCRYLQLDDTSLAYLNDPEQRKMIAERGDDAEHQHLRYIRTLNEAVKHKPADMAITTHMCRGNNQSSWVAEGSYDFVAEDLFTGLDVDGFFLEYDDERSGGFEPLRFVPAGKAVVLGLVTTKRGALEDPDMLKRRIEEASRFVPLEQLCLSPQCGFSSTVEGNLISHSEQWAKLERVVEVADAVWG